MDAWWSYRLEDFLLFSAQTYGRLFELHNAAWWPLQVPAAALGAFVLWAAWRGGAGAARAAVAVLAVAWGFVAWAWHLERFAPVQWAAPWFAAGFALQALGLAAWAARGRPATACPSVAARGLAVAIAALALIALPLLPLALGRPAAQAEWFGLMPDPTALLTLAVLLLRGAPVWLWPLPLGWCAVTGATLWPMQAPHALLAPLAAGVALVAAWVTRRARAPRSGLHR